MSKVYIIEGRTYEISDILLAYDRIDVELFKKTIKEGFNSRHYDYIEIVCWVGAIEIYSKVVYSNTDLDKIIGGM